MATVTIKAISRSNKNRNGSDLRLFILAGEASGDALGADLIGRLQSQRNIFFDGVGGAEMQAAGLTSQFPMENLSVMGFADVIGRLPLLLWRLQQTVRHIMRTAPDCVVLIDSQEFSVQVAKRLRKKGFAGRVILYVAPSVWAWRPQRAKKIQPLFDEVLALFPFEPQVMARLEGPLCTYVGHPAVKAYQGQEWFLGTRGKLAVLPGSRSGEIRRHMALFTTVIERLRNHPAISGIVLPTLPRHAADLRAAVRDWPFEVEIVTARAARDKAFSQTVVALASAGTISLELALAGVPMVATYVPDAAQMRIYEALGRPAVTLPNIVLAQPIVPEIAPEGEGAGTTRIAGELKVLLEDAGQRRAQQAAFEKLRQQMAEGVPGYEKQDAADRILRYF